MAAAAIEIWGQRFVVGLADTYIPDWHPPEALRELVQNFRDAVFLAGSKIPGVSYDKCRVFLPGQQREGCQQYEAKYIVNERDDVLGTLKYDASTQVLTMENPGELRRSHLHVGTGSKRVCVEKPAGTAGMHGEGLKMCAVVLCRRNMRLTVMNNGELWEFSFQQSPASEDQILNYCITELSPEMTRKLTGKVLVQVENVTMDLWSNVQNQFLDFTVHDLGAINGSPSDGFIPQILKGSAFHGKLYVNGIFVQDESKGAPVSAGPWGYNIQLKIDRDRRSVPDQWERYRKTSMLHADVADLLITDPLHVDTVYKELSKNNHSLYYLFEYASPQLIDLLWGIWAASHPDGAMPQSSPTQCANIAKQLKDLNLGGLFYPYMPSASRLFACLSKANSFVSFDAKLQRLRSAPHYSDLMSADVLEVQEVARTIQLEVGKPVHIQFKQFPSECQYIETKKEELHVYLSRGSIEERSSIQDGGLAPMIFTRVVSMLNDDLKAKFLVRAWGQLRNEQNPESTPASG